MAETEGDKRGVEEVLDDDEYVSWFSYLYPWPGYIPLLVVSASVSIGIVTLGYVIAVVGNSPDPDYFLFHPTVQLGAIGIFWTLAWLGWFDRTYIDMWNEVRPVFDIDAETYRSVVHPWLDRIYDERRFLRYWAFVAVPSYIIIGIISLPWIPPRLQNPTEGFIWTYSLLGGVISYLYTTVETLLLVAAVYIFFNHMALLREVSELPFRDLYTSASELEPIVGYSMAGATAWFVGVSGVGLWMLIVPMNDMFELVVIVVLVLVGVGGFFAPMLVLHFALADAKQRALVDIRKEYEEMHRSTEQADGSSEDLSFRLEITDRRLESVKSVDTWPYDVYSVGELFAASVIPGLTLIEKILRLGPVNDILGFISY